MEYSFEEIPKNEIQKQIKKEELIIAKERLKDLKDICEITKLLNTQVNNSQEPMNKISENVEKSYNNINQAEEDLLKAIEYKDKINKKKIFVALGGVILGGIISPPIGIAYGINTGIATFVGSGLGGTFLAVIL